MTGAGPCTALHASTASDNDPFDGAAEVLLSISLRVGEPGAGHKLDELVGLLEQRAATGCVGHGELLLRSVE
jgi:hypothetical protein